MIEDQMRATADVRARSACVLEAGGAVVSDVCSDRVGGVWMPVLQWTSLTERQCDACAATLGGAREEVLGPRLGTE